MVPRELARVLARFVWVSLDRVEPVLDALLDRACVRRADGPARRAAISAFRSLPGPRASGNGCREWQRCVLRYREDYGLTYFGVLETHMTEFAKVIDLLC